MATAEARRRIPSVDALLRTDAGKRAAAKFGRPLLAETVRRVLAATRDQVETGDAPPPDDALLAAAVSIAARASFGLGPVINATGVILHTGLGRAPLPIEAAQAAARAAVPYSDLEVDRETGARGRRTGRAELLLTSLTGAEAALVVNNNAAALVLALAALAKGKQVPVSRGELIEIGGAFRLPDILGASGAKLVEVGTTNRTRIGDYRAAMGERTGALLKVHPSNYKVIGFAQAPSAQQLANLAHKEGVPFVHDVGSGLIDRYPGVPNEEPSVIESLQQGADLVLFSGDKLLGGPQAGIIVGAAELVERLRRHPLARAMRVDKMQVAALESVLAVYARGEQAELPVWRMLREGEQDVKQRAQELSFSLGGELEGAHIVRCESVAGGGSLPGFAVASWGVRLATPEPQTFSTHLRMGNPSVFCRVEDEAVVFDVRTVGADQLSNLTRAITYAMESDPGRDEG